MEYSARAGKICQGGPEMKRSGFVVMKRLIGLVKPLTGFMVLAILMGVLGNLFASGITIFGGYLIVKVLDFPVALSFGWLFAILLIFALLRGILRYAEQACNHFIAFKLLALIRDKVFLALRKLAPAKLDGKDKGDLISVITSDIELLEVFYAHTISPILIAILFSVCMLFWIGSYHWLLALIAAVAYVFIGVIIPYTVCRQGKDQGQLFRKQAGELSGYVLESLRGLDDTLQYQQGQERLKAIESQSESLIQKDAHIKYQAGWNRAMVQAFLLLFDLLMLVVSSQLYKLGLIGMDGMLIATLAMMSSFGPVVSLANLGSTLQYTFAAGNRVLDILDEDPIVLDVKGMPEVAFEEACASHVEFSYGDEKILKDFNVKIPKGKVIGIAGKSGSGKSTFLKLLMRFWQVDEGEILISHRNVNDVNTENLRKIQSFVMQDTHLFKDSILNNLRIAKQDASMEEVIEACKKASIHDLILTLPQGYDTPVGELGDRLSQGEKQRMGLARAFLHDADLMLLDEPTSNLDSLNEAVILKALFEERKDKTVVLVSHRTSTMQMADAVYSVENGRIS